MLEFIHTCLNCDKRLQPDDRLCLFCGRSTDDAVVTRTLDSPTQQSALGESVKKSWQLSLLRPDGEQTVTMLQERTTIGRSPQNDLQLDNQQVSRFHAVIEHLEEGFAISDLDSTNGTAVYRRTIHEPTTLQVGDAITIGEYRLMIQRTDLRCRHCRRSTHVDDRFCRRCGDPLTGVKGSHASRSEDDGSHPLRS